MTVAMLAPDLYSFISVLLRALVLSVEVLVIGGVLFRLAIVRDDFGPVASAAINTLLIPFAVLLTVSEIVSLAFDSAFLMRSESLTWTEVAGAGYFVSGLVVATASAGLAAFARTRFARFACPVFALFIVLGIVMTSHSMARIDGRPQLAALTFAHHIAGGAWIGGMPYLVLCLGRTSNHASAAIVKRFSSMALVCVPILAGAGFLMSRTYVGSVAGLGGTSYGLMVTTKVVLTGLLLLLGALNLRTVQRMKSGIQPNWTRLRRLAEAEAGIGITVILTAASLTSSPPAVDLQADRVSRQVIVDRIRPVWPRMRTPPVWALTPVTPVNRVALSGTLAPGQSSNSSSPADIAWSEYNHHWAGIVVLAIGILSLCARRWRWARSWPLVFLGLALFLLIRADSENWPLGPRGFWESFQVAEVAQHRLFVILIVAFAIFEWRVQTLRAGAIAPLVFPLVCIAGGALLLTHSHSLGNIREEFLAEVSHIPLAIFAIVAGWSRWLEIRLAPVPPGALRWIWPVSFMLIGVVLLDYREA